MTRTPEQVVQQQVDAYNAHDIDAFMATYSPTIQMLVFPTNKIMDDGAESVRAFFQDFFGQWKPHVEISQRLISGNFVIDHEIGSDLKHGAWQGVAIYEVVDELIQRVWFPPPQ